MDEEQLKELQAGLAAIQSRLDDDDAVKERAAKDKAFEDERNAAKRKFGHLYDSEDDDITDLLMHGLQERGASVESATEDAVVSLILEPLSELFTRLAKSVTKKVEQVIDEVIEGTTDELAIAAEPEDVLSDISPPPMEGDMGMPPPPLPGEEQLPPYDAVSDVRYKDVAPCIVSDSRFKTLGTISDQRLKALESLSKIDKTVLSDEDKKAIIFADVEEEPGGSFNDDIPVDEMVNFMAMAPGKERSAYEKAFNFLAKTPGFLSNTRTGDTRLREMAAKLLSGEGAIKQTPSLPFLPSTTESIEDVPAFLKAMTDAQRFLSPIAGKPNSAGQALKSLKA